MTSRNVLGASYSNLTEVEVAGLKVRYDLANGHAYHDFPIDLQPVIQDLPNIWQHAAARSVPEIEEEFKAASANLFGSATLADHAFYSISPTASNSIDIVGAWLNMKQYNVGLIEPVFDNLYLILKRRGVNISSIQESDLINLETLEAKIKKYDLKSLFIVTPNNPTGFQLNASEYHALCDLCAKTGVVLIVDKSFRFYSKDNFDDYKILNESGVDYAVIEDTGKTWPTQDSKVSLMAYSKSLAQELRMLYEEIYLCSSNFTLAFLSKLVKRTQAVGLDKIIHEEVAKRRSYVDTAFADTPFTIIKDSKACSLPLAWIDCSATGIDDLELVQKFRKHQVALLPGRFFFWDSQQQHTSNIRLSLMKPDANFYRGVDILCNAIPKIMSTAAPGRGKITPQRGGDDLSLG